MSHFPEILAASPLVDNSAAIPQARGATASADDVAMTRKVAEDGSLLNIDVLDHIVIARNGFVSLRERHLGFPAD